MPCRGEAPLYAGTCSNPTGNEADVLYNGDSRTYQFCNGTNWIAEGGIVSDGGLTLISTQQTASNSASLQFTNLPTSYNTLFLNCAGLVISANGNSIYGIVREGAGPTWETTAHYTNWGIGMSVGLTGAWVWSATNGAALFGTGALSTTSPVQFKAYIDNVGSSSLSKMATVLDSETDSSGANPIIGNTSWNYWNNDTNPITGLEVIATTGTITSGTCTLYGLS